MMMHPLPELCATDLRRSRVFHQVEQRNAADSPQPGLHIPDSYGHILFQTSLRNAPCWNLQKIGSRWVHLGQLLVDLVRLRHDAVEHFQRHRNQTRMRHPRAVVAVGRLAFLVGPDLGQRLFIRHRV